MKQDSIARGAGIARLASMIGLCRRAGRLGCGVETVTDAIKTGRARLVLLVSDPSDRTRKLVCDKCASGKTPLVLLSMTKEELGAACGMAELSACAVTDSQFAHAIAALAGRP